MFAILLYKKNKYNSKIILISRLKRELKPPYTWNLHVNDCDIHLDFSIYSLINTMRFRFSDGPAKIDWKKTIDSICKNAGFSDIQYKYSAKTRPSKYLMLIDKSNENNHQTQLFEYFFQTFANNNVHINRYFYDSDPRICWNEIYNNSIGLDNLQQLYHDVYLLVFSNGAGFINPFTNMLYQFTDFFKEWKYRALLTPEPSAHWGIRETILANLFTTILPATTEGFAALVEQFEEKTTAPSNLWDWRIS